MVRIALTPLRARRRPSRAATLATGVAGVALALAVVAAAVVLPAIVPAAAELVPSAAPPSEPAPRPGKEPVGAGAVLGRVRDWDGNPVPGATVTLRPHGLTRTTGANGQYAFYEVPVGRVLVRAEKDGFVSAVRGTTVELDVVHELNFRLSTPRSPEPLVSVHKLDGRVSCGLVALGAGVGCENSSDHVVNLTRGTKGVVVELVWEDEEEPTLNLSASPAGARDPLGRPPAPWAAAEGGSVLRLRLAPPPDATELQVVVRHGSDRVGVPTPVPYSVYVTVFHDREPPESYSVFRSPIAARVPLAALGPRAELVYPGAVDASAPASVARAPPPSIATGSPVSVGATALIGVR